MLPETSHRLIKMNIVQYQQPAVVAGLQVIIDLFLENAIMVGV
jgi:hypothetical protein